MKKMNYAEAIIDTYNVIVGAVVAVLSYILGEHWLSLIHISEPTRQIK